MGSNPVEYWARTFRLYQRTWSVDHFHYGFWDESTRSHADSLTNTVRQVAGYLNLGADDRVLDAGCGVGGATRYMVEHFGVEAVGIANVDALIKTARRRSLGLVGSEKLTFLNRDYRDTGFEDGSFTRIFALESACYAPRKEDFLREAHRLLAPGGRLVVADGFQFRTDLKEEESRTYNGFLDGWYLPNLASVDGFRDSLERLGFRNIEYRDITAAVRASSNYMYRRGNRALLLHRLMSRLRLAPRSWYRNAVACVNQRRCIEEGIWGYGIFAVDR
jgi:cyclopropane fatty-acyl-phospholipid synthase-like methyltransferase